MDGKEREHGERVFPPPFSSSIHDDYNDDLKQQKQYDNNNDNYRQQYVIGSEQDGGQSLVPEGALFLLPDRMMCYENFPLHPSTSPRRANAESKEWFGHKRAEYAKNITSEESYITSRPVTTNKSERWGTAKSRIGEKRTATPSPPPLSRPSSQPSPPHHETGVEFKSSLPPVPKIKNWNAHFPPIDGDRPLSPSFGGSHSQSARQTQPLPSTSRRRPLLSSSRKPSPQTARGFGSTTTRSCLSDNASGLTKSEEAWKKASQTPEFTDLVAAPTSPTATNELQQTLKRTLEVDKGEISLPEHHEAVICNMRVYTDRLMSAFNVAVEQSVRSAQNQCVKSDDTKKDVALSDIERMKRTYSRYKGVLSQFTQRRRQAIKCEKELLELSRTFSQNQTVFKTKYRKMLKERENLLERLIPAGDVSYQLDLRMKELRKLQEDYRHEQLLARSLGQYSGGGTGADSQLSSPRQKGRGAGDLGSALFDLEQEEARLRAEEQEKKIGREERTRLIQEKAEEEKKKRLERELEQEKQLNSHFNEISSETQALQKQCDDIVRRLDTLQEESVALSRKLSYEQSQLPIIKQTVDEKKAKLLQMTKEYERKCEERKEIAMERMKKIEDVLEKFRTSVRGLVSGIQGCENELSSFMLDMMCTFCFNRMKDPQVLWPCGHSFCKECIVSMYAGEVGDMLQCSECLMIDKDDVSSTAIRPFRNPNSIPTYADRSSHVARPNELLNDILTTARYVPVSLSF